MRTFTVNSRVPTQTFSDNTPSTSVIRIDRNFPILFKAGNFRFNRKMLMHSTN